MKLNGGINLGKVSRIKLINLLKKTKFCLSGDDNLLSFFNLECINVGVKIIFNYKLKFQVIKEKKNYLQHTIMSLENLFNLFIFLIN